MDNEALILSLICSDRQRMRALSAVRSLELPDWFIAAGFVRNRVWDHVFMTSVPLTDIDVIYFCSSDTSAERDMLLEKQLSVICPGLLWSVKNQARMHLRNNDSPYSNTWDAMAHWPEKQTAIGVSLNAANELQLQHCFSLDYQFFRKIDHNPACGYQVFVQRMAQKRWLNSWPGLEVSDSPV